MLLTRIPLSLYAIEELDELGSAIAVKLTDNHGADDWITPIIADLNAATALSRQAIGNDLKKAHTQTIRQADRLFNQYFIGFRDIIYSYANSPDENEVNASALLSPILEKNDDKLYQAGYSE